MADPCPHCHRRIPDWHDAAGPDDCRGGESCREREEDRTRLAWRVVEAARPFADPQTVVIGIARHYCIGCWMPVEAHAAECGVVRLRAALRALDREG